MPFNSISLGGMLDDEIKFEAQAASLHTRLGYAIYDWLGSVCERLTDALGASAPLHTRLIMEQIIPLPETTPPCHVPYELSMPIPANFISLRVERHPNDVRG